MAELFGHEKLKVYEKTRDFVGLRSELLARIDRRVSACDHLDRGAESILLNIAHASSSWSPKERVVYLGHANGSALECAACLDVFVARMRLTSSDVRPGKSLLREIVSMLIAMKTTAANRVREEHFSEYTTVGDLFFSHEKLEVYQAALRFSGWIEDMYPTLSCSTDVLAKLDKSSTAIILNIAEGNGRFSQADHVKFLRIAYKATIQSASLVDVAIPGRSSAGDHEREGMELLRQIAAMLTSLAKAVLKDT